jgi:hypothetical protein
LPKKHLLENNHEIENLNTQATMGNDYEVIFNILFASKSVINQNINLCLRSRCVMDIFYTNSTS